MKKYHLLFISLLIFYFVTPLIFFFENSISNNYYFSIEKEFINFKFNNNFIYYLIISIFLLFFSNYFFLKNIINVDNNKIYKSIDIIIIICLIFIFFDVIKLVDYQIKNYPINRSLMYYEILDKRNTYINILLILSVANYYVNKKLSLFGYFFLIIYNILSYSRIELILLLLMIFLTISISKKELFKVIILFSGIFIFIIFYRFVLSGQNFILILVDPLHVMISSMKAFNNLWFVFNEQSYLFLNYLKENLFFFLNDFLYLKFELFNFYKVRDFYFEDPYPVYSARGTDSIFLYFFVFLFFCFLLNLLIKKYKLNKNFYVAVYIFLVLSLFRGNCVHNLGFIIKLYILIICLEWLIQKLKLLKLKVV